MLRKLIPEDCVTFGELKDLAERHREDCDYFIRMWESGVKVNKDVEAYLEEKTDRIEKRMFEIYDSLDNADKVLEDALKALGYINVLVFNIAH